MDEICDNLYLVKPGKVIYDEIAVRYASSAVVLIDDGSLILVDTALPEDWDLIKEGIDACGYDPGDIDLIINTHLHIDHVGCNDRFNVVKYAHAKEIERGEFTDGVEPYRNPVTERVEIIETPGHTWGHISVVYHGEKTVVIAGDAIPTRNNYYERVIPRIHVDAALAMESFLKVERIAEIIIPGHDDPIRVER
ncbi:MAG TPA: MBL fold metallo-hydrolase [Candidatus Syntrophoarchaeum butanivorans]|uniref:Metallo-beta-lactamase domain-containing protein 1 n=1 Tax=Candidatus Syntropharchaeum butanivorans TaxID=1839936 RepID=A0A1F2P5Q1_9EURY|nr:MAG: Beta-lactamase-like domain protein [Candidatus Syntrophoarchaeum butanivorans]HDM36039.1 MBL fold metallo-hydrolase [Candidatus Syntrophoarchaeum butanivorans]HEC56397.1 MBL fold metallo-hydrolase [Candidatus Syntrophoarchaeum butanivorans]